MTLNCETLFDLSAGLGRITLNRPRVLNALAPDQFGRIDSCLRDWDRDDAVGVVVIDGAGERAFCAGGDIRAVWDGRLRGDDAGNRELFRAEYRLDRRIHHYRKPYVALLDGIVMGGGAGVSVNGRYRVATERTLFAMPEAAIGFFPDVGATHFLSRCPGRLGLFLGLTGTRLGPAETVAAGLATHYVPAEHLDELIAVLRQAAVSGDPGAAVAEALDSFHRHPGPSWLDAAADAIDGFGQAPDPGEYLARLQACDAEWASAAAASMLAASPTSLAIAFRQLTRGRDLGFDDAIRQEFRLACSLLLGSEFHEGIRALVVDKDRSPRWQPAVLTQIPQDLLDRLFAGVGDELTFP